MADETTTTHEPKPTTKMKDPEIPILFTNKSDEFSSILSLSNFHKFWKELEIYVRSMLIECPEETNDPWYTKWQHLKKFQFSDPATPSSLVMVCIMESITNQYTFIQVLDSLTQQIPYLGNHIYYTASDDEDASAAVKLKLFQSYDYKNPYHICYYTDTSNSFNAFQAVAAEHDKDSDNQDDTSSSLNQKPAADATTDEKEQQSSTSQRHAFSPTTSELDKYSEVEQTNEEDENVETVQNSVPGNVTEVVEPSDEHTDSLLSFSLDSGAEAESTLSVRSRRKQNTLKSMIVNTCKEEIANMQSSIIAEVRNVLTQHINQQSMNQNQPVNTSVSQASMKPSVSTKVSISATAPVRKVMSPISTGMTPPPPNSSVPSSITQTPVTSNTVGNNNDLNHHNPVGESAPALTTIDNSTNSAKNNMAPAQSVAKGTSSITTQPTNNTSLNPSAASYQFQPTVASMPSTKPQPANVTPTKRMSKRPPGNKNAFKWNQSWKHKSNPYYAPSSKQHINNANTTKPPLPSVQFAIPSTTPGTMPTAMPQPYPGASQATTQAPASVPASVPASNPASVPGAIPASIPAPVSAPAPASIPPSSVPASVPAPAPTAVPHAFTRTGQTSTTVPPTTSTSFSTNPRFSQQQYHQHHSSTMHQPSAMFGQTQSAHPTFSPGGQQHVKGGVISFRYNNLTYELRDTDFIKYAGDLLKVNNSHEIIHFYKHHHTMALQRNIFITDFEHLSYWDRQQTSIPPTCFLQHPNQADNSDLAYKRMRAVLYQKISKAEFVQAEHRAIIQNHSVTQDGFAALYDLAARCHPHLLARTSRYNRFNTRPQMLPEDNIYTLKRKYENWLELEKIDNHKYTDECILRFIMEDLREDSRYDKAVRALEVELSTFDTMKRHTQSYIPFPMDLYLHNIPQTVMACYTDDEKESLFSSSTISKMSDTASTSSSSSMEQGYVRTLFSTGDHEDIQCFINVMKSSNRMPARESLDQYCQGCGKYGHDIFHQGCDFCAQLSIALKFLDKHPDEVKKIIKKYMSFQRQRKIHRKEKEAKSGNDKRSKKKPEYNRRNFKATVRALQTALNEFSSSHNEDSDDSASYADAKENDNNSESSEASTPFES